MRSAIAIIPLFALMRLSLADLDWDDIPGNCRSQCEPVINDIFVDCARAVGTDTSVDFIRDGLDLDRDGRPDIDEVPGPGNGGGKGRGNGRGDNDRHDDPLLEQRYVDCVCNKQNARTDIPACSDCLIRNGYRDKEAGDFVRACNIGGATGTTPGNTFTTTNAAGNANLRTPPSPTLAPTPAGGMATGVNNNNNNNNNRQPVQATGAASKLGAQNVLVAAALVGLSAVFL